MNCEQVQARMLDYVVRDLLPDELEQVEEHIKQCGACRTDLTRLQHSEALLRRVSREAESPNRVDAVTVVARTARRLERSRGRWRWLTASAALAVVLLLAALSLRIELHRTHLVVGWSKAAVPVLQPASMAPQFRGELADHQSRLDDLDELILLLIQKGAADEQRRSREAFAFAERLNAMQEQNDTRWRTLNYALRDMRAWPSTSSDAQYTSFAGEQK